MAVEDSIVSYLDFVVKVKELLDVHLIVFHVISLPNITYNPCIKPFSYKLKWTDSKGIPGLQIVIFCFEKHFV